MVLDIEHKACTKCGDNKPLHRFTAGRGLYKLQSHCKDCRNAAKREWHKANRERTLNRQRESRAKIDRTCCLDGCEKKATSNKAEALCRMHECRVYSHGDVGSAEPYRRYGTDDIRYNGAHLRVYSVRGKASSHSCVDCGSSAEEWSYSYGCPRERTELRIGWSNQKELVELAFSPDPHTYDPRCRSCHRKFDRSS